MKRQIWFAVGALFLALGAIGVALPVMPTVPFLLVAAWAFARSSPRLRQKILDNPTYGPSVRAWQERGAISRIAKIWAVSAMAAGIGLSIWLGLPVWVIGLQAGTCAAVGAFVASRPEQ
ncbi:YbaN family protein [Paracoccus sp. YLB-12]|uniref:YbaN family protein n=1 Tax=Paracoccus maritimus TaxID=2933292 RepID=A0ABT2K4B0_9RHOB|nr:YbaN family protein [Paracoccus sp. YLB-12]MCT4331316.1 YbaN family protein [Paracoccus sp. YLB-12]